MRKDFGKARDAALSEKRKGTRWRKNSAWLFCERNGVFIDTFFIDHRHQEKTSVHIRAKPMAIDSLFWRITGMPENEGSPLSLRANGAFVCSGATIVEKIIDDEGLDPAASADEIFTMAELASDAAMQLMNDRPFSQLLESTENARGLNAGESNAPSYLTALILDDRYDDARQLLSMIASGQIRSRSGFSFNMPDGTSSTFFEMATVYIDSQSG